MEHVLVKVYGSLHPAGEHLRRLAASVAGDEYIELDGDLLERHATPDEPGRTLLMQAAEAMRLSARGYTRMLRVARTIADLANSERVGRIHVAEALSYRRVAPRA